MGLHWRSHFFIFSLYSAKQEYQISFLLSFTVGKTMLSVNVEIIWCCPATVQRDFCWKPPSRTKTNKRLVGFCRVEQSDGFSLPAVPPTTPTKETHFKLPSAEAVPCSLRTLLPQLFQRSQSIATPAGLFSEIWQDATHRAHVVIQVNEMLIQRCAFAWVYYYSRDRVAIGRPQHTIIRCSQAGQGQYSVVSFVDDPKNSVTGGRAASYVEVNYSQQRGGLRRLLHEMHEGVVIVQVQSFTDKTRRRHMLTKSSRRCVLAIDEIITHTL